ncbi:MAG TPA: hypothetical protein VKB93_05135 [Thermoanaerobaculia bacterium]|nr:hypothetical protein [Thermoanaerobaculia bacterium]
MHRASAVLVFLLCAAAAHAQTAFQRGDVIAQTDRGGPPIFPEYKPVIDMSVFDRAGARKAFYESGSTIEQFPRSHGLLVTGGLLYAAYANQYRHPIEGFVAVSPDARTVTAEYLKEQKLLGLADLLQMRSGNLLLSDEDVYPNKFPKLVQFTRDGKFLGASYLPPVTLEGGAQYKGARFIELLADQCTVAWTLGEPFRVDPRSRSRHIRAFNICTNRPLADLFVLPDDTVGAAAIRQLPNGDFLVATFDDVRRFDRAGKQLAVYPVPAFHLALTPDANGFWAGKDWNLQRVDFAAPDTVAAVAVVPLPGVSAMTVVDEWRAALQPVVTRRRATR